MFDLRTMSVKWETNLKNGVSIDSQHSPNYCNNNKDNNDNNSSIFSLKLGLMDFHIELRRNFTDVSVRSETRLWYSRCNPRQLEILIAAMKLHVHSGRLVDSWIEETFIWTFVAFVYG